MELAITERALVPTAFDIGCKARHGRCLGRSALVVLEREIEEGLELCRSKPLPSASSAIAEQAIFGEILRRATVYVSRNLVE